MRAVILNAGSGKRLRPLTNKIHKSLLALNGRTILEHQLLSLKKAGVKEVILVTGAFNNTVIEFARQLNMGMDIISIFNPFYKITENIVSLWLAKEYIEGELFILMGDIIFDSAIASKLKDNKYMCSLAVHHKESYEDDDMKVNIDKDRVNNIAKDIKGPDAEYMQISYYSEDGSARLKDELCNMMGEEEFYTWYPRAIQRLIGKKFDVNPVVCDGHFWIEIDSLKDYERAKRILSDPKAMP